jgi:acetoin utilization deacetylase AcuC-like enzyme
VDELARNHDRGYVEFALEHMKRAPGRFDADTFFSEGSRSAALLAAGGTLDLVAGVVERRWDFGFAIPRPPGHHATPRRAMGFCIFNNLAVAAHAALASGEVERILVFDWDLHHGNGTQESFWSDGRLLYVSIHQWPFFPGSGLSDEVGAGGGRGTSVNFPFPPGAGNDEYACVIREVLTPLADEFSPDLVLVSVGFDTHMDDLIGSMKVDEDGFAAMARSVADIAGRHAGGRLALVLEGGYNIQAEAQSAARVVETLLGAEAEIPAGRPRPAYRDVMDRTLKEIAPYWKGVL